MNTFEYILERYKIKVGGRYIIDIPNIGRDDMATLFSELKFNEGAEVGVELGLYSEVLLEANKELHLNCIDPWEAEAYEPGVHAVDKEQRIFDGRYEECKKRLSFYGYNVNIIRKRSLDALDLFPDESLDFVYIDANHDFPNFTNDLHQWTKKVKIGGIVSGHDYAIFSYKKHNHVKRALDAYARSYRMIPFFVLGSLEYVEGQTRDKYRSWMWVRDK